MSETLDKKIDSSSRKDEKVHLALKNHYYLTLNALATATTTKTAATTLHCNERMTHEKEY
jgi:hypothetical protein